MAWILRWREDQSAALPAERRDDDQPTAEEGNGQDEIQEDDEEELRPVSQASGTGSKETCLARIGERGMVMPKSRVSVPSISGTAAGTIICPVAADRPQPVANWS